MNKKENSLWKPGPAIIAYTNATPFWWMRWLASGFRHCLIIIGEPPYWLVVDGLWSRTKFNITDLDGLVKYLVLLHRAGYRCQFTYAEPHPPKSILIAPYTCSEVTKRVLGINAPWVFTPKQIYNFIKRNKLTTKRNNIKLSSER